MAVSAIPQDQQAVLENWWRRLLEQQAEEGVAPVGTAVESPFRAPTGGALPVNYAQSSSGTIIDFGPSAPRRAGNPFASKLSGALPENYAQSSSGTIIDLGPSRPRPPDPWVSGPVEVSREQQRDGTLLVTTEVPALDGSGRQSSKLVRRIEIPDYLNPAKLKELQYRKMQQELQGKPQTPQLVDGQWVYPPSADQPGGAAYPVPGFQRRSASDAKVELEREQKALAQERVGELLSDLHTSYKQLQQEGAVVDPQQNWLKNVRARTAASGVGQLLGGAVGTQEQEIRDKIQMAKPLLINEIRAATGMSAKAMDSNAELQFYLQAATDPTRSIDANLQALDYLDRAYAGGRLGIKSPKRAEAQRPQMPEAVPQMPTGPASQQIRDNGAFIEAGGKRYVVIRRNPDGSAVIRDPQTGRTGTMRQ